MSRLEELIAELCPDGVQFRRVDDVCHVLSPKIKIKSQHYNDKGIYPIVDQSQKFISGYTNEEGAFPKGEYVIFGDHTCVVKYVDFSFVQGADGVKVLKPDEKVVNSRYLFHCMSNIKMTVNYARHWSKMRIKLLPVPPLAVQREIVRVLDSFTLLTAELTAELTARKKQYDFYRNKLLTFDVGIEYKSLEEIAVSRCTGGTPLKTNRDFYEGGNIPWLRTQEVVYNEIKSTECFITEEAVKKTSAKWIPVNCVIVAISGASAGRCAINKIPLTTNQHCLNIEVNVDIADYKYVYYCLCNQYEELVGKKEGARGDLSVARIMSLKIPIPSLDSQKRTVAILDRFDILCNDISLGLPAEIEARRKQYEYYRDKLLSF